MKNNKEKDSDLDTLSDVGVFYLSGDIDETSCKEAAEFILECNLLKKQKLNKISLVVTSWGGYVAPAFGLIDIIEGSSLPVHTVGLGYVGSAALLIFMSGHQRTSTPNTVFLSHQFSGGNYGKAHDLVAAGTEFALISDIFLKHYKKHTGLPNKKILKELLPPSDVYLNVQKAKKLNLVDKIVRRVGK